MNYKQTINDKHFLLIGSKGHLYHTKYALDSGIKVSLLIEKDKYIKEYEELFSSVFIVDNIFDFNQIKEAIKNLDIDVVFTRFEDYIAVVGALNEYLGLKGIDYSTSRNFGNKYKMKQKFLSAGVPCAYGVCADNKTNIENFIKQNPFPLILKKASGVHSSFVYKVKSKDELTEKLDLFLSKGKSYKVSKPLIGLNSPDNKECDLILETMLKGIEVTVDTFVSNKEFTHTPICEYVLPEELNIDDSYLPIRSTPTDLPEKVKKNILDTVETALKALGANNCVCHTELFCNVKNNKCWIVETTPRGGGNRSIMIRHVTDTNYDKEIYLASAGKKVEEFVPNGKTSSIIEYFAPKIGTIQKINLDFLKNIPETKIIKLTSKVDDEVKPAYAGGKIILSIAVHSNNIEKTKQISINIFNELRKKIVIK